MWLEKDAERRRQYDREYHARRTPASKQRKLDVQVERRRKIRQAIADFKRGKACACGEDHPACLDFHHKNDDKEIDVADAVRNGWGIARVMAEIAKCQIICSNCHRKLHWERNRAPDVVA